MTAKKTLCWLGAAILVVGLSVTCGSGSKSETAAKEDVKVDTTQAEAARAITIRLMPGSELETGLMAMIERDANKLLDMLGQARIAALEYEPKSWAEEFKATSLMEPMLTLEDGITKREGWEQVLMELKRIVDESASISIPRILVELEYLPYKKEKFNGRNEDGIPPEEEIDMIFHVKMILLHESAPSEVELEGDLLHRRVCWPY